MPKIPTVELRLFWGKVLHIYSTVLIFWIDWIYQFRVDKWIRDTVHTKENLFAVTFTAFVLLTLCFIFITATVEGWSGNRNCRQKWEDSTDVGKWQKTRRSVWLSPEAAQEEKQYITQNRFLVCIIHFAMFLICQLQSNSIKLKIWLYYV